MIQIRNDRLEYALRFDETWRGDPQYRSPIRDQRDPDVEAIKAGKVREILTDRSAKPHQDPDTGVIETQQELLARLQAEIQQEWALEFGKRAGGLETDEIRGLFWDGRGWNEAPLQRTVRVVRKPAAPEPGGVARG